MRCTTAQPVTGDTVQVKAPESGNATVTVDKPNKTTCQGDPKAQEEAEDQEEEPPADGMMTAAAMADGMTTGSMEAETIPMTMVNPMTPTKSVCMS